MRFASSLRDGDEAVAAALRRELAAAPMTRTRVGGTLFEGTSDTSGDVDTRTGVVSARRRVCAPGASHSRRTHSDVSRISRATSSQAPPEEFDGFFTDWCDAKSSWPKAQPRPPLYRRRRRDLSFLVRAQPRARAIPARMCALLTVASASPGLTHCAPRRGAARRR